MLHQVCDDPHETLSGWCISESQFSLLLNIIEQKALKTITFEDIPNEIDLKKCVILTFDDCPTSLFDFAIPELIRRKMKAVFLIPSSQVGGYNKWDVEEQGFEKIELMNASQLVYLSKQGMEIGSHGKNHARVNSIPRAVYFQNILESKKVLEKILEKQIHSFAYPYGEIPKKYRCLLKEAGFKYGIAIYSTFTNPFRLRRIGIHPSDTPKSIAFKLSKTYRLLRYLIDPLLNLIKLIKV